MSEESPQEQIDDSARELDRDLDDLDSAADDLEERLEENEARGEEIEVPEPGHGDDLNLSKPDDDAGVGTGESDIPADQGERANEAGQ
jgi:hypothetical protein